MNKSIIIIILAIAALGMGIIFLHNSSNTGNTPQQNGLQTSPAQPSQQSNSSKVLFASTPYAQYSYQIYPGTMTQQANAAMSGFNMTSTLLQNSSAKITIELISANQSQSLILAPGDKLYLIEAAMGDDAFHFDSSLGDDGFVIVNSNGYVVQ